MEDHLSPGVQGQPGEHGRIPVSKCNTKQKLKIQFLSFFLDPAFLKCKLFRIMGTKKRKDCKTNPKLSYLGLDHCLLFSESC